MKKILPQTPCGLSGGGLSNDRMTDITYTYGNNNPIKYNDPSGHCIEEGDAPPSHEKQPYMNVCPPRKIIPPKNTGPDPFQQAQQQVQYCAQNQFKPECRIYQSSSTVSASGGDDIDNIIEAINIQLDFLTAVDYLRKAANYGRPYYKQLKGLSPSPIAEGFISGGLQFVGDLDNPGLNIGQRVTRAGLVGVEAVITDGVSDSFGLAGFAGGEMVVPSGGGLVGYPVAAMAANGMMEHVWDGINKKFFPLIGLGTYP